MEIRRNKCFFVFLIVLFTTGCMFENVVIPRRICDGLNPRCIPAHDQPLREPEFNPLAWINFIRGATKYAATKAGQYAAYKALQKEALRRRAEAQSALASADRELVQRIQNELAETERRAGLLMWNRVQQETINDSPEILSSAREIYDDAALNGARMIKSMNPEQLARSRQYFADVCKDMEELIQFGTENPGLLRDKQWKPLRKSERLH